MASQIDENTQFVDTNGTPLNNGKIYIGAKGLDPKLNPISIYSDRALQTLLDNPQILNSAGRSTNKIWIPEEYSFRVDNTNDVQQIQDLDAGTVTAGGVTTLINTQGTNTIIAQASDTITSYIDKAIYVLTLENAPTGAVTLNIDSIGALAVIKQGNLPIVANESYANQIWAVAYNAATNTFELLSDTFDEGFGKLYTPNQWTKTQNFDATILTSASNLVAWDAESNQVAGIVMTENTTFSAPTNMEDGAIYNLQITQDAGASAFTIAFDGVFKFVGGQPPVWTTSASAIDFITFRSNGTFMYHIGHALDVF